MERHKVISDTILATQETMYLLQMWVGLLESWCDRGCAEPADFMTACQQLKESHLWPWATEAGGHGLRSLANAIGVSEALDETLRLP